MEEKGLTCLRFYLNLRLAANHVRLLRIWREATDKQRGSEQYRTLLDAYEDLRDGDLVAIEMDLMIHLKEGQEVWQ